MRPLCREPGCRAGGQDISVVCTVWMWAHLHTAAELPYQLLARITLQWVAHCLRVGAALPHPLTARRRGAGRQLQQPLLRQALPPPGACRQALLAGWRQIAMQPTEADIPGGPHPAWPCGMLVGGSPPLAAPHPTLPHAPSDTPTPPIPPHPTPPARSALWSGSMPTPPPASPSTPCSAPAPTAPTPSASGCCDSQGAGCLGGAGGGLPRMPGSDHFRGGALRACLCKIATAMPALPCWS